MFLSIFDLSGIQSFIFATNKLREIAGASAIVRNALSLNVPNLIKKYTGAEKIYIGGGNALVKFNYEKDAKEFARELQKMVFLQSGGALRICFAIIKADENKSLAENQKKLMEELDKNKKTAPNVFTAKGFSINAHENTTFEPFLLFGNKVNTKTKHFKLNSYEQCDDKKCFVDNFDVYKVNEEGEKNYLAVIHIDGNTMGIRIRKFVENLSKELPLAEQLKKLAVLSEEIDQTFHNVLDETIKRMFSDKDALPFRKVICDGDDVTVICLAKDAFKFVEIFMNLLSEKYLPSLGKDKKITAGAGVAIVKFRFPFYTAYEIAEQLCKNAKRKALDLGYSGENSKSSMDFHVCYGGITTEIKKFRNQNYKQKDFNLSLRPYVFGASDKNFDYKNGFEQSLKDFYYGEDKMFAKNKLKELRNAYVIGINAAKQYSEMIKARHKDKEDEKAVQTIADNIVEIKSGKFQGKYAKYFDVLDVLDFLAPDGVEEDNG
jgi:hypothetical protein